MSGKTHRISFLPCASCRMSKTICLETFQSILTTRLAREEPDFDYIQHHFQVDKTQALVEKILSYPSVEWSRFTDTFFDTNTYTLLSENCFLKKRRFLDTEKQSIWSYKHVDVDDYQLKITEIKGSEEYVRASIQANETRVVYANFFLHLFTRRLQIPIPGCKEAHMFVDCCHLESNYYYTVASYRYRPSDEATAIQFINNYLADFKQSPVKSKTLVAMYTKPTIKPLLEKYKLESKQQKEIFFYTTEEPDVDDFMIMQLKENEEVDSLEQ